MFPHLGQNLSPPWSKFIPTQVKMFPHLGQNLSPLRSKFNPTLVKICPHLGQNMSPLRWVLKRPPDLCQRREVKHGLCLKLGTVRRDRWDFSFTFVFVFAFYCICICVIVFVFVELYLYLIACVSSLEQLGGFWTKDSGQADSHLLFRVFITKENLMFSFEANSLTMVRCALLEGK